MIKNFFYKIENQLINILLPLLIILPLLILCIAIYTYAERKGLASIQKRRGPNMVGFLGLGQPFADGIKLFLKEHLIPSRADKFIFGLAPIIAFTFSLSSWLFIPIFNFGEVLQSNIALLFVFGFSSISAYGIILAGWASNSRYAMLGTLRATAQLLSYEIVLSLTLLPIIFAAKSLSLTKIIWSQEWHGWYIISFFPSFILFSITAIAETNRPPFDLPEAEAEIVAGYFVEYSAMSFALFFLAEYAHMILMSHMIVVLFLGGWTSPFSSSILFLSVTYVIKLAIALFYFIWLRATFPRFRYDQLMLLGWKVLLPITLFWVLYSISFLWIFSFKFGSLIPIW